MFSMKNLVLASAFVATSMVASATTVTSSCSAFPDQFNTAVGSNTVSCAAFTPVAGETLTSVTLAFFSDYTFGTAASNDIKVTYTLGAPAGVTWAQSSISQDVLGGFSSSSSSPATGSTVVATAGITAANFASAFNVGVSSSVVTGGAGTSSAGVTVTYVSTPTSTTPEPASFAMIGAGLLALAGFARRRNA